MINKQEKKLSKLYAPDWKKFKDKEYKKSVSLFQKRLEVNGFDIKWFKDKICLDAGCGSGRYIQAMIDLGVKKVVGIDINTNSAKNKIKDKRVVLLKGDIREIPYKDDYFDFICCNGVLHHVTEPKKIIDEFSRILKKDGYLFLYVFDPYTEDWELIDSIRKINKDIPVERFKEFLKSRLELPINKIHYFADLIYAPIQKKFTKEELICQLLKEYEIKFMTKKGISYDNPLCNRLIARKR